MKIELAENQSSSSSGQEPPKPPPLPPPPAALTSNGDNSGQNSKTNTINSNNGTTDKGLQDTATRKQQQPLSAISIQDLNSVQVCNYSQLLFPFSYLCKSKKKKQNCYSIPFDFPLNKTLASTNRKSANKNFLNTDTKHEHAMLIIDK